MRIRPSHLTLLLALAACSSTPTGPDGPEVRFSPRTGGLLVAQGSFTRFAATGPDGRNLTAEFRVDGSTKHRGLAYNWNAGNLGSFVVEAEVDLGDRTRTGIWVVEVRYVDPNDVPTVTTLAAVPGTRWGTLVARWDRPAVPQLAPGITGYRVYFSQRPFASVHDDDVQWIDVDDEPASMQQSATLFDLDPTIDSHVRVVAINAHGASSLASSMVVARSRGNGSIDLPPPTGLAVHTPPEYGSLLVSWQEPDLSLVGAVIDHYRLYWSTEPFEPDETASAEQRDVAATDPAMNTTIDGLAGETRYSVRVQAFAKDGRSSALSQQSAGITLQTPVLFTLSGRALELDWSIPILRPFAGAAFQAGVDATTSDAGGWWTLPTETQGELHLEASSGGDHYGARTRIVSSEDQEFEILFFPRRTIDIVSSQSALDGPMSHMEFLHRFTGTRVPSGYEPRRIYRWEEYPVQVQKSTLVRQGNGEMVDYGAAFERAVTTWNDLLGVPLLQLVSDAPQTGVSVAVDIPDGGASLGEVRFVDPPNGWFTKGIPRHLRLHLASFNYQDLADRIILHELGHVLGLLHSPSDEHVMGSAAPDFPLSADEAEIARLLSLLPQGAPLSWYLED